MFGSSRYSRGQYLDLSYEKKRISKTDYRNGNKKTGNYLVFVVPLCNN